jgi:hypothetical protein
MLRPLSEELNLAAIVISKISTLGLELILASLQLFFAISEFLPIFAKFATVLPDLFSARTVLNVSPQLRTILLQLVEVLLVLFSIFTNIFSRFAHIANILADLAPPVMVAIIIRSRIAWAIKDIMFEVAISELPISPTSIVGDQIGATRDLAAKHATAAGRGLMAGRPSRKPNTTHARRGYVTRGHAKFAVIFVLGQCRNRGN